MSKNRYGITHKSSIPVIVELHRVPDYVKEGLPHASKQKNAGQFYIIFKKSNGRKLSQSTDYYKRRYGALNCVRSMYGKAWEGDYRDYSGRGKEWALRSHNK